MIRQARTYDLKHLPIEQRASYGVCILATRLWLRGIRKVEIAYWVPDAAPSKQLLSVYRAGFLSGEEFLAHYECEQRSQQQCRIVRYIAGRRISDHTEPTPPLKVLKRLEQEHEIITVTCKEREPELCHRHRLCDLLMEEYRVRKFIKTTRRS